MQDARKSRGPTHLAVIFDASEKTFRNEIYQDYKAHRPPAPEELVPQFPLIRDAVKAFNIACIEQNGFEADDLIATYARDAIAAGGDVTIVSSDKDLMQLVKPGVTMLDTMKNKTIGPDEVREKFGVAPDKVVDVQALAGDSTDNVPGVPGIGVKTAAELIRKPQSSPICGCIPSKAPTPRSPWLWATSSCASSISTGRRSISRITAAAIPTCRCLSGW
jgi:DNA polymerase-1